MKSTNRKDEHQKYLTVLRKSEWSSSAYLKIAKKHEISSSRPVQRWIAVYIKEGIDRLRNKKPGGAKSRITDEDK